MGGYTESQTLEKIDEIMNSFSPGKLNQSENLFFGVALLGSRINWLAIGIPWPQEALIITEGSLT